MVKITRVVPSARAPHLVLVEVDGAPFVSVGAAELSALGFRAGAELGEDDAQSLRREAEAQKAHESALRVLAARPHAVAEMLRKLRGKGFGKYAAAKAVGRLEDAGLLDDSDFAEHYARVKAPKGFGPPRLLRDLLARGIERTVAERAIQRALEQEDVDVSERRAALAEKRARQLDGLPEDVVKRRVAGYLRRRGL